MLLNIVSAVKDKKKFKASSSKVQQNITNVKHSKKITIGSKVPTAT